MPDRIYRMTTAHPLRYEVRFQRKHADLSAIRTEDPVVHTAEVVVTRTAGAPDERVRVTLRRGGADGPSREVALGDTLLEVYGAVREVVEEAEPGATAERDLAGCALVFRPVGG
jgi:hypothetical protein